MVKRGLKPGETFVDGGRTYEVLSVEPNGNYVSKEVVVEEESVEPEEEAEVPEEPVEAETAEEVIEDVKPTKKGTRKSGK